MHSQSLYLPGLNGIRAFAAMGVLLSHIIGSYHLFGLDNTIAGVDIEGNALGLLLAPYGVTMFFTLSGFLITYLLLQEKEQQPIRIKHFYIRRMLRIWPLYFLYFFVALLVAYFHNLTISAYALPFYIFMAANIPMIFHFDLPFLGHYWSLGIEEQFYVFFPFLAKKKNKVLLKGAILLIIIFLLVKIVSWYFYKFQNIDLPYRIITVYRMHTMLFGVVAAVLYHQKNRLFMAVTQSLYTQIICWIVLFLTAINQFHIASVFDGDVISLITVCIIIAQISKKNRIISLENKVCNFLGKISFGIYVIHPLIITLFSKITGQFTEASVVNYAFVTLSIILLTILLAYLSYRFFEQPFLKQKRLFSSIQSSNSPTT